MAEIGFERDPKKARANLEKHGVSFDEARSMFYDDEALFRHDDEHSCDEDRFVLLGLSSFLPILVVVHCFPGSVRRDSKHLGPDSQSFGGGPVRRPT